MLTDRHRRAALLAAPVALSLFLGLFAQGSRALWEPDEGRNAAIAAAMLASGDAWVPRLGERIYLDKPPLAFWAIAASRSLLGPGELAIRLPGALAQAATTALVLALGLAMAGRRIGLLAAIVHATALAPFVAANVVTPDGLLTLWVTLAGWAVWRALISDRTGWWLLAGGAAGLGMLTKGAAMLVFAAAFAVGATWVSRGLRWLARPGPWLALALALALGLPWFVSIARALPGAAEYLYASQVSGRLLDDRYDRNAQWYRAFTLYLPTLALGALPWSLVVPILRRRAHSDGVPAARELAARAASFLAAWILVPFLVFSAARSRLPLYVLPLFAPLALALAAAVPRLDPARPSRAARTVLAGWILFLVGLKLASSWVPARRDAARNAEFVNSALVAFPAELWVVDADLWALPLYGAPEPRRARSSVSAYPMFEPLPPFVEALRRSGPEALLVVTEAWRKERVAASVREALDLPCSAAGERDRLVALRCGDLPASAGARDELAEMPRRFARLDTAPAAPSVQPR